MFKKTKKGNLRVNQKPKINKKILLEYLMNSTLSDISEIIDTDYLQNEEQRTNSYHVIHSEIVDFVFIIDKDILPAFKCWLLGFFTFVWKTPMFYIRIFDRTKLMRNVPVINVKFWTYYKIFRNCKRLYREYIERTTENNVQAITKLSKGVN